MRPALERGMAAGMTKSLAVQQFVPEQTIQSYLDALLQDAAAELAVAEQVTAPTPVVEATMMVV